MTETDHIRCVNEGGHVPTQRHPRSECPEEANVLENRIRTAYATAMNQRHVSAGRVEIHVGSNVREYLTLFIVKEVEFTDPPTLWGFPVFFRGHDDYIAVHVVEVIA